MAQTIRYKEKLRAATRCHLSRADGAKARVPCDLACTRVQGCHPAWQIYLVAARSAVEPFPGPSLALSNLVTPGSCLHLSLLESLQESLHLVCFPERWKASEAITRRIVPHPKAKLANPWPLRKVFHGYWQTMPHWGHNSWGSRPGAAMGLRGWKWRHLGRPAQLWRPRCMAKLQLALLQLSWQNLCLLCWKTHHL